jgi:integrase
LKKILAVEVGLAMGGVDENTRAELLGHAKRTMTSAYTHASWKRKIEAVEIMGILCGQYLDIEG